MPSEEDGYRVLVDRLWLRGLSKGRAKIDLWVKEVAPSDSLRKWFAQNPKKWAEFKARYLEKLDVKTGLVESLIKEARKGPVTLFYGAKDQNSIAR